MPRNTSRPVWTGIDAWPVEEPTIPVPQADLPSTLTIYIDDDGIHPRRECTDWGGLTYYRIPESRTKAARLYFRAHTGGTTIQLHREVWKYYNGAIPPGHDIHHINKDTGCNEIWNLACLDRVTHARLTQKLLTPDQKRRKALGCRIRNAIRAAQEPTPELQELWRRNGKKSWVAREPLIKTCAYCGKEFENWARRRTDRFCSVNCGVNYRTKSGAYDVTRVCPQCGKQFKCVKSKRQICCSHACGTIYGKKIADQTRQYINLACEWCGKSFQRIYIRWDGRFCSPPCRTAASRANQTHHEERVCEYCGTRFMAWKWGKTRFCSRSCAHKK